MKKLIISLILGAVSALVLFLPAQLILWGLAYYHIQSGLIPVWMIAMGVSGIITGSISMALETNKD